MVAARWLAQPEEKGGDGKTSCCHCQRDFQKFLPQTKKRSTRDDLEPNAAFPYNFYGTSFGRQYHDFFLVDCVKVLLPPPAAILVAYKRWRLWHWLQAARAAVSLLLNDNNNEKRIWLKTWITKGLFFVSCTKLLPLPLTRRRGGGEPHYAPRRSVLLASTAKIDEGFHGWPKNKARGASSELGNFSGNLKKNYVPHTVSQPDWLCVYIMKNLRKQQH